MSGVILQFPQYAFIAWCSVKKSTGRNLPYLTLPYVCKICKSIVTCDYIAVYIKFIQNEIITGPRPQSYVELSM
jgi:hypothetical protein